MRGEPLVVCFRHPDDGPILHRADRQCPVCRLLEQLAAAAKKDEMK